MQVVERVEQLVGPFENLREGERAARARAPHLFEVGAADELHDEELPRAFVEVVAHAGQRRVRKPGEQTRLALELPPEFLAVERRFLERDGRVQALVQRLVNRAHPAARELAHDAVAALQGCARIDHLSIAERRISDCGLMKCKLPFNPRRRPS